MSKELKKRGKALEDQFFIARERQALAQLRAERQQQETKAALSNLTMVKKEEVLNDLVREGIDVETFAAIKLVPLVLVAWVDNVVQESEREAVLAAANKQGIGNGCAVYEMLNQWLQERPSAGLKSSWLDFMNEYVEHLSASEKKAWEEEILGSSQDVAEASGGWFFGFGAVSAAQQQLIDELHAVFI